MKLNRMVSFGRLLSGGLLVAASATFAVDYTWQGGPAGDWNISANWSPDTGTPSTASDNAIFNDPATVAIPDTITLRTLVANAPVTVTVASDATLNFSNNGGLIIDAKADTMINGDGEVTFTRNGTSETDFADIRPVAGVTLTIAARISGLPGSGIELNAAGTLVLANPNNSFTGFTRVSTANGVILFTHPGALGLRAVRIEQSPPSKLAYTGTGPATVTIPVNLTAGSPLLENAGSGALTLNGDIFAASTGTKTLTLASPTAQPFIINGAISNGLGTVALIYAGPGMLTFNGTLSHTGNTTLRAPTLLNGTTTAGTFLIEQGTSLTISSTAVNNTRVTLNAGSSLVVESGAIFQNANLDMAASTFITIKPTTAISAITFPANNNLNGAGVRWVIPAAATASTNTFPSLIRAANATLDITASDLGTPRNTLLIGNLTPGPQPSWFTVNGGPAIYDATLGVMPVTAAGGTASINALGPQDIPNDPTVAAVIDAKGTAGAITLAADPTGIFSLTQDWAGDAATVNLGGKTLIASIIDITPGGNDLTINNGLLTAPSIQTPPSGTAVFPTLAIAPIAWFDFADTSKVTTDPDNRITGVANKGSLGSALDAAVPANYVAPLYVPNAVNGRLGVARTDGNWPQQGLATLGNSTISGSNPRTLFLVASRSPVSGNAFYAVYMGDDTSNNNRDFAIVERPTQVSFVTRGSDLNIPLPSPLGHNVLTFISGLNGVLNDRAGFRNGEQLGTLSIALSTVDAPIFILHRPSGNVGAISGPGDVAEVILFDYALSATDREAVEDYLMRKWGVADSTQRDDAFLALRNASTTSDLAIPAALSDPFGAFLSLSKFGPGNVTLGGPASFSGSLLIDEGTFTFDTPDRQVATIAAPVGGAGQLVKKGPGSLMLSATSTYSGGTLIQGGTVYQGNGNAPLLGTGPLRIENGAAFDIVYGVARNVTVPVFVEGFGPDGLGALRNSSLSTANQNAFQRATLTGDTSLYSVNRFDVRGGAFDFGGHSLTLNGGGMFSIVNSAISNVTPNVAVNVVDGLFNFETSNFQGSSANSVNVSPGAGMAFYNLSAPFLWSVTLADDSMFRANVGDMNTNVNVQAGPVILSDGTSRFNAIADGTLSIPAVISGPGGLLKEGPGWVWLFNPNNTYQGHTTVTQGNLYAVSPGSLGTSGANPTIKGDGASFVVRVASATSPDGWPDAIIKHAIASADAFDDDTFLGLDTLYENYTYTGTYPFVGLKKLGPHKLTLTDVGPDLGGISIYSGELDLSNTGDHNLHTYSVQVGVQNDAATRAVLRLANTSLDTTDRGYNTIGPVIGAGIINNSRGTIHIGGNARVNGRLRLGTGATANTSFGAIYQTSGVVTNNGGTGNIAGIGVSGYGYYRLDDGEFASKGQTIFGELNNSSAIFEQRGGSALINPGNAPANGVVGDYYNGTFTTRRGFVQFMLSGGTLNLNSHSFTLGEWGGDNTDGIGSLTLENDAQMSGITTLTLANRNGPTEAYINLNGGSLSVRDYFIKGGNNTAGNTSRAAIAFNGGTLRVSPPADASVSLVQTAANNSPTLLNVYPGGAVIDITSPTGNITLDQPLRAPANLGLSAINITNPGDGYIAPPVVTFSGGNGTGATAFAEIDLSTGTLTAIRVTSPGVGYTGAPTIAFRGGGNTANPAASVVVGAVKSGGLTKLGPGRLSLNAKNTYTGPTVITDGTLRLGAGPDTLAPDTAITVSGGTLDLGGATHTNTRPVTIESGGIVNGTLSAAFTKTGPGTATLSIIPAAALPTYRRETFIRNLEPLIWYDPSDTTDGNVTLNGDRVIRLRNKGTGGPDLDAIPYNNGTGPLLVTGANSCAPFGLGTLHVSDAGGNMTTAINVPISGFQARTLIAILARDNGTFGVATGRACVGIGGGGNTTSWELGADSAKTYLSGLTQDLDWSGTGANVPPADQLCFMAAVNGFESNFARGMQVWRDKGLGDALETKTTTWGGDNNITAAPFSIARRGNGTGNARGKYGDILLFDRILSADEIAALNDVLAAKWRTDDVDYGNDGVAPPVKVEEGTLVLSPFGGEIIARLNPVVWYDPSDASTVTLDDSGRITALASKGTKPNMDATPGMLTSTVSLIAPTLATGTDSYAKTGLPMISLDASNEGLASTDNIGITGAAPRTSVGIFARHNNTSAGPVVAFGNSANGQLWEFGDRQNRTVVGGFGNGNDLLIPAPINPVCTPDVFIATHAATHDVSCWRTLASPTFATMDIGNAAGYVTAASRFFIGQRPNTANRTDFTGQIGEQIVFDRVLDETERTAVQSYLKAKWMTGAQLADGTELDGVTFEVAAGATLDLGNGVRSGITVTGNGTIANGKLGDGFIISPAGDDAIGELAFENVTFGAGTVYRLTTIGNDSDCILVDGDISALTIVPSNEAVSARSCVIATGAFTGKPTLDGFPSKYQLIKRGNDLLLNIKVNLIIVR